MSSEDEDKRLEEMLRKAASLENEIRSRSSSRERSAHSRRQDDDMMRHQAERLSQKLRSSRQQAVQDEDDVSVDDMLRKAEVLSRQMRTPDSSPPRTRKIPSLHTMEGTPGLIRQSENMLSNMYQDQKPAIGEMNSLELMRQTENLLGRMRSVSSSSSLASLSSAASRDGSYTDNDSTYKASNTMSDRQEAVIAKLKAGHREASLLSQKKKRNGRGEQDAKRSAELRRLMEQALSSWSGSRERKGRVKDALEQDVPDFSSSTDTPSTVSIQQPHDGDDISSVGSMSPRSGKPEVRVTATSLLNSTASLSLPSPSSAHDIDAAEMVLPSVPSLSNKGNMPRPPPLKDTPPPRKQRSSVPFTPNRRTHVSSEEAQYNAIMAAIDSSGGRAVSWENVESAGAEDDDFVPLADYSEQGGARSLGVGTFEIPVMGRSPRVHRRRRKIGRIIVVFLALVAAGYKGVRTWRSGGFDLDKEPAIVTKDSVYFEDTVPEPVVTQPVPVPVPAPVPVPEYSNAIVIHIPSPWAKMRIKMARVAQRARRQFMRAVLNLTPPWERFCVEGKTCRDTDYLLERLDHP